MKKILLLLFFPTSVFSQSEYPQDYFRKPLDITPILSGTFAELRSNHFHSGLDFKTQQKLFFPQDKISQLRRREEQNSRLRKEHPRARGFARKQGENPIYVSSRSRRTERI